MACLLAFAAGALISALAIELAYESALSLHHRGYDAGAAWAFVSAGFAAGTMMSFTVMGDTVNLAARLESANKVYGSRCQISEATADICSVDFEVREIDRVVLFGQIRQQTVYEVMGRKEAIASQQT
jgi:class 3 adenylate cyclase